MSSIGFTDKCGVERNRALPAITIGSSTQLHPRSIKRGNESSRLVRCKARDGYCVDSEPQTLRTEARAPAIKTPHAEKREIQWKRNGRNEWMTGRRGRAGEKLPRSLRRCYNWRQRCTSRRGAISFALSRMSEQKAHSKPDPSCLPLHLFFHLQPFL